MLNERITKLINGQINMEWYSAYFYLAIQNYYVDQELNGFGNWFGVQTQEEHAHAMLFVKYMQNNGAKVVLESIAKPDIEFKSIKHPLDEAYEHELFISKSINEIYAAAYEIKDFRTMQFL